MHNWIASISFIAGYVYFINTQKSSNSDINHLYKCYLTFNQVDRKTISLLTNEDLALLTDAIFHCFRAIYYIISEMFSQYFSQAMQKISLYIRKVRQATPPIKEAIDPIIC